MAALYALLISIFIYKTLGWKELVNIVLATVKTTCILSLLVGSAFSFSYIIGIGHIPDAVVNLLLTVTTNKYILLLLINIMFHGL